MLTEQQYLDMLIAQQEDCGAEDVDVLTLLATYVSEVE